jgi:hypothetical protein
MSTADKVYELVKTFSEEQAQLVLKIAQLVHRRGHQSKMYSEEQSSEDIQSWHTLVQELSGAWADFPSAEELRNNLGQDLVRESFAELLDELVNQVKQVRGENAPILSDYAVRREGIYEEHL